MPERQHLDQPLLVARQAQIDTLLYQLAKLVADQTPEVAAIAENIDRLGRLGILMHLAQNGRQGLDHGLRAVEVQGADLVPRVAIDQIDGANQALLFPPETEHVAVVGIELESTVFPV